MNQIDQNLQEENLQDSDQQNDSQQVGQAENSEENKNISKTQNDIPNEQLDSSKDQQQKLEQQETIINEDPLNTILNKENQETNKQKDINDNNENQQENIMEQSRASDSKVKESKLLQQNNETESIDFQVSKEKEEQPQNNQSNIEKKQDQEQIDKSNLSFGKVPGSSQENTKQQNSDNLKQDEQILSSEQNQQQSSKISTTEQQNQQSKVKQQNPVKKEENNNISQKLQENNIKNQEVVNNLDPQSQIKGEQISENKDEQVFDSDSKIEKEQQENNEIEQKQNNIPQELTSNERSKLRERFLMDLARPKIKKHKNENDRDYESFTELPIDIFRVPRKKSANQNQMIAKSPAKKQNAQIKIRIIQDLKDFKENNYKILTEAQKLEKSRQLEEQEQMQKKNESTVETAPLDEKQRKIESLKKDLKRFEQVKQQEIKSKQSDAKITIKNKSLGEKKKKKNTKSHQKSEKKQMSISPEIKVVYDEVKRKIEIKNDIRSRIQINKDEGKNKEALEFVRKMQRYRHESESKRNKQLENIGQRIQQGIDKYKTSNQIAKIMLIKEKRKKALESITNQEKKRLEIMSKQQMNLKFVQDLRKKADYLGHYSVKKLTYPMQMITELDNGQIQLQDMIDTNRKLNEKQFLSIEDQKQQKLELVKKSQDYAKQVSLLHFPKVNLQKQDYHETIDEQPVIKQKQKKAWQIEQELQQKQSLDSSKFK